ncbi:fat storage-inducing transmembrane protein 1 [Choloepus didactylus]|uniref:fat storage-inducing transmembrane protein 1 n=1 Tax=Choloepus didactylus TaxID=27675 RepID=UPI00189C8D05|nr:fat storage-inducing transmembrane protein 1 [Choloepus didactylus]
MGTPGLIEKGTGRCQDTGYHTPETRTLLTWQLSTPAPYCPPPLAPACQPPTGSALCLPHLSLPVCVWGWGPHQPLLSCPAEQAVSGEGGKMEQGPVVGAGPGLAIGSRIRALLGCLLRVLLWLASALLYFGSEQAARLLGSRCLQRLYHAWLAAVVIFGPLLQFHVNPRTIFASHGNFFNIKFVNSAWGWTCTFLGGFVLLVVFLATRRVAVTARHLSRLVVGAAVWRGAGRAFLLIEDLTGSCFEPLPQGLLLHELPDRRSCLAAGHQWRGYTVSSHTFLLTFCCLLMAEEAAVFAKYLAHGLPAGAPLRLVFLLNVLLLGLWNFLLLCTVIYFHQYTHKVVGAAVGTFAWYLTYGSWYHQPWSPGSPGHGLFPRSSSHKHN